MSYNPPPLYNHLLSQLDDKKFITLYEVMKLALYDENYGYYSRLQPFGAKGDFITSPLVSQMFGEIIAANFVNQWYNLGSPNIILAELGPGDGTLIDDILNATKNIPEFHSSITVVLLENSKILRAKQKNKLEAWNINYHFIDEIKNLANFNMPILLVANEFLDALPIKTYKFINNSWHEIGITNNNSKLEFSNSDYKVNLEVTDAIEGSIYELNFLANEYIKLIDEIIFKNQGLAIFIDYGYLKRPEEKEKKYLSTLQSVKNHKFVDVLENIGNADITTHVDFEKLTECVELCHNYNTTQRNFLIDSGIVHRCNFLIKKNSEKAADLSSQMHRLIDLDKMGNLFKVLVFYN